MECPYCLGKDFIISTYNEDSKFCKKALQDIIENFNHSFFNEYNDRICICLYCKKKVVNFTLHKYDPYDINGYYDPAEDIVLYITPEYINEIRNIKNSGNNDQKITIDNSVSVSLPKEFANRYNSIKKIVAIEDIDIKTKWLNIRTLIEMYAKDKFPNAKKDSRLYEILTNIKQQHEGDENLLPYNIIRLFNVFRIEGNKGAHSKLNEHIKIPPERAIEIIDLVLFYDYVMPLRKAKLEDYLQSRIDILYSNLEKYTNNQEIKTDK